MVPSPEWRPRTTCAPNIVELLAVLSNRLDRADQTLQAQPHQNRVLRNLTSSRPFPGPGTWSRLSTLPRRGAGKILVVPDPPVLGQNRIVRGLAQTPGPDDGHHPDLTFVSFSLRSRP